MDCRTCTFRYVVQRTRPYVERKSVRPKEVDDVLGGAAAWDNADSTAVRCPIDECEGDRAFYFQKQIRSADEGMTSFYRCTKCHHQWREN